MILDFVVRLESKEALTDLVLLFKDFMKGSEEQRRVGLDLILSLLDGGIRDEIRATTFAVIKR